MNIPEVGADGNHVFEQRAGFGGAIETFFELVFLGCQASIDLAGTDGQEFTFGVWVETESLAGNGDPIRESGLKPLGTKEASGPPDCVQDADGLAAIENNSATWLGCLNRFSIWLGPGENADGVFAMAV